MEANSRKCTLSSVAGNCTETASQCSDGEHATELVKVSVIITAHNARPFLADCLNSIRQQTFLESPMCGGIEICLHDDCSNDDTQEITARWWDAVRSNSGKLSLRLSWTCGDTPRGPGFGRNCAIYNSTGEYMCILDADDLMAPSRIELQLKVALQHREELLLIGSQFERVPVDATSRYANWANGMTKQELTAHCFRDCTIVQPTWFFHCRIFTNVGRYTENIEEAWHVAETGTKLTPYDPFVNGSARSVQSENESLYGDDVGEITRKPFEPVPEDLIFFLRHVFSGGALMRVDKPLVSYRYSASSESFKIERSVLLRMRALFLERHVLDQWDKFSVWSAGRDAKRLFNALTPRSRRKVTAFYDINEKKIETNYHNAKTKETVPIKSMDEATWPFITVSTLRLLWLLYLPATPNSIPAVYCFG
eukprot:gb/GECG01006325.1/.p1 GENE.gb/GECG01006325.1/~~gb/GECG01006325.1/.p1  ORF type:complete len:423 (+),score=33.26 gb/GECG01006325.1/:1-1269(+)